MVELDYIEKTIKSLTYKDIAKLQALVNWLREDEQLRQYVNEHTLSLYDTRLLIVDVLLDKGILR